MHDLSITSLPPPPENLYRFEKAREKEHSLPPEKLVKRLFTKKIDTHHFENLYRKKQEIERSTLHLLTEYDHQKQLEATIKKLEEEVEAASRTKHLHEEYKMTQTFKRWVQVPTECPNIVCGARGCFSNCHGPCYLEKSLDKEVFKHCANFGGGDLSPSLSQVLPALAHLISHEDREVVSDTCWALSYLTDSSTERIQAVIDSNIVPRLVQLLGSSEISCVVRE